MRAEGELERFKEQKMEQTLDCNVRLVICLFYRYGVLSYGYIENEPSY